MNKRCYTINLVIMLVAAVAGGGFAKEATRMATISVDEHGFKLQLPSPNEKQILQAVDKPEFIDAYTADGLAYVIRVDKLPENTLASTAIEQDIQNRAKSAASLGGSKRWELDSRQGRLFKGLSAPTEMTDSEMKAAPFVQSLLGGKPGYQAVCMASLKGESSPILSISVIGPREKMDDIESMAKFVGFTVSTFDAVRRVRQAPSIQIEKKPGPGTPTGRPTAQTPGSSSAPIAALKMKPTVRRALKKGEIELTGTVASLDPDGKGFTMLVNSILLPRQSPIKIEPARSKIVNLKQTDSRVVPGAGVVVVGRNLGVGSPILADLLELRK